jgi:uncharacterized sulfatase
MERMKKELLAGLMMVGSTACAAEVSRPNFIFIMMDDFGAGQFAPEVQRLSADSFDPAFVRYVAAMKDQRYSNEEALKAAQTAMPTMSRLAKDGILFSRAFASSALCAPSRSGFATGIHQNRFGVYENADVNDSKGVPPELILARRFQAAGYATGHIGKWHLGPLNDEVARAVLAKHGLPADTNMNKLDKKGPVYQEIDEAGYFGSVPDIWHPLKNGFDYYYGYNYHQSKFYNDHNVWENFAPAGCQSGYNTETFTGKAISFIDSAIQSGKPFFINVNFHAVHGPLFPNPPEQYMAPFADAPALLKNFYGHVFAVDEGVRKIIEDLKAKGVLENTCIVFTSDNGAAAERANPLPGNAPHRGHKGMYTQGGIRVPMVIYWPARISQGRRTEAMVSLLDILPTAMDAAGIQAPDGLDGKSLLPLIDGKTDRIHDQLVWFGLESCSWGFTKERSLIGENVRNCEPGSWTVLTDSWLLRFTGTLAEGLYKDQPAGIPAHYELYDVRTDPGEKQNVFDQHPETAATLKAVAAKQTSGLPPPVKWSRPRWDELKTSLE